MKTFKIMLLCLPLLLGACKGKTTDSSVSNEKTVTDPQTDNSRRSLNAPKTMEELLTNFTGTFSGTLPCADCGGILTTLTLNEDGTYILETEYQGKGDNNKFTDRGKWTPSEDLAFVELGYDKKGEDSPVYYALIDKNTLEKLDIKAKPIDSNLNYKLKRK